MTRMVLYGRKVAKLSEPSSSRRSIITSNCRIVCDESSLNQRQLTDMLAERECAATISDDKLKVRRANRQ